MIHLSLFNAFKTTIFVSVTFFLCHFSIAQEKEKGHEEGFKKEKNSSKSFSNMSPEEVLKPFKNLDLEEPQKKHLQDIMEKHYATLKKALGKTYLDYERNSKKIIRETWRKTEPSILKMLKKEQYSKFKKEVRNIIKEDESLIHDTKNLN